MAAHQFVGALALHLAGVAAGQQVVHHEDQGFAGGVGEGVVMRDVGLGAAGKYGRFRRSTVTGQGDGQGAHGGAVAGVVFGGGRFRVAGLAELDQVAAHRVADIDRLGAHPGVESRGGALGLDASRGQGWLRRAPATSSCRR